MEKHDKWLNNPDNLELADFLVTRTKNAMAVMNVRKLAIEFKNNNKSSSKVGCLGSRIVRFRQSIHKFSHFNIETKVKLLFALSASVDPGFLRELRKEAEVEVDGSNRIVHYKKSGGLELKGRHKTQGPTPEVSYNDIYDFLAKKVEEKIEVISILDLSKQFKVFTGSSQSVKNLGQRFSEATQRIYESEGFNENMKVRMMFATRAVVPDYALEELRKNAIIVLDDRNRITDYRSSDGSLYLQKGNSRSKTPNTSNLDHKSADDEESDEDVEEENEETADGSDEEETMMNRKTNKRGLKRRLADDDSLDNDYQIEFDAPDMMNEEKTENVIDNGFEIAEEIPAFSTNDIVPKQENVLTVAQIQRPIVISSFNPRETEITGEMKPEVTSDINSHSATTSIAPEAQNDLKNHTSRLKVLESLNSLMTTLELKELQKTVEEKIRSLEDRHAMLPNQEIRLTLALLLAKVNRNAHMVNDKKTMSVKEFVINLKFAYVSLQFPSPDSFQKQLKGVIEELRVKDKEVPLTILRSALQTTIYNIMAI